MWWNILAIALLFVVMLVFKMGAAEAVAAWGAWIAIPFGAGLLIIGLLVDRHDRKKLNDRG